MAATRSSQAWERVLAVIEADAARAAALLAEDGGTLDSATGYNDFTAALRVASAAAAAGPGIPAGVTVAAERLDGPASSTADPVAASPVATFDAVAVAAGGVPATWRLPGNPDTAGAGLPDPAEMPPIPAELRDRIERLRRRIDVLQRDLARALQQARVLRPSVPHVPHSPPGYVDRRL